MTSASPEKDWAIMDNDYTSWVSQFFDMVGVNSNSAAAADNEKDEEQPTKKVDPAGLKRASTVSTVFDSEHFDSSGDLYHDGEQGWETTLSKGGMSQRIEKYTRHPHFVKRFSICTGILMLVIVLVSVLCATLTGEDSTVGVAAGASTGSSGGTTMQGTGGNTLPGDDTNGQLDDTGLPIDTASDSMDLDSPVSPFSTLDPVEDLGMFGVLHSQTPPQSMARVSENKAMPTNAWYQNLIIGANSEPTNINKAYAVPYMVDVVGPIPGLRIHPNHLDASATMVQLLIVEPHGLTLGASGSGAANASMAYSIQSTNPLGLTLEWVSLVLAVAIVSNISSAVLPLSPM